MKRPMEGQMALLFEEPPATDQILEIGQVVYKVMCDVITTYEVAGTFNCEDYRKGDGSRTVRYYLDEVINGKKQQHSHDIIGKYNIYDKWVYFTDLNEAKAKAEENLSRLDVIRAVDMKPIESRGFESMGDRGAFAILPDNRVYHQKTMQCGFIDQYENEYAARKAYKKVIKEQIDKFGKGAWKKEHQEIEPEFEDMYGMGDGRWASYWYAFNNWLEPTFLLRK